MRLGRRNEIKSTYYVNVIKAYKEIGLLVHIPLPTANQPPEFYEMCLARAEECRLTRGHSTGPGPVLEKDLPLGPLGLIKFVHHKDLEEYLDGKQVESVCYICREPICTRGTVLSICECISCRICQHCLKTELNTFHYYPERGYDRHWDHRSYLSLDLLQHGDKLVSSTKCISCRALSYTITNVDQVREEDYRLINYLRGGISTRAMTLKENDYGWYYGCIGDRPWRLIVDLTKHPFFQSGGKYEELVPWSMINELLLWVEAEECYSFAQRRAAILSRLIQSGPTVDDDGVQKLPLGPSEKYVPLKDVILEAILRVQGENKQENEKDAVPAREGEEEGFEVEEDEDDEGADEDDEDEDDEEVEFLSIRQFPSKIPPLLPSSSPPRLPQQQRPQPQSQQPLHQKQMSVNAAVGNFHHSSTKIGGPRLSDHAPTANVPSSRSLPPPPLTERERQQEQELASRIRSRDEDVPYSLDRTRSLRDNGMDVAKDAADTAVGAGSTRRLVRQSLDDDRPMDVDGSPQTAAVTVLRSSTPPPPYPHPPAVDTQIVAKTSKSSTALSSSSKGASSSSSSSSSSAPMEVVAETAPGGSSYRRIPKKPRADDDQDDDDFIVAAATTTDLPRSRYSNSNGNNSSARTSSSSAPRPLRAAAVTTTTTEKSWQQQRQRQQQQQAPQQQQQHQQHPARQQPQQAPQRQQPQHQSQQSLTQIGPTTVAAVPSTIAAAAGVSEDVMGEGQTQTQATAAAAAAAPKTTVLHGIPSRIVTASGLMSTQGSGPGSYVPHPLDPRRQAAEARQAQAHAASALQLGSAPQAAVPSDTNGDNILATQQQQHHHYHQLPLPAGYLPVDPYATVLPLPVPVLPAPSLPHHHQYQYQHQYHHPSHLAYGRDGYADADCIDGYPLHHQQYQQEQYQHPQQYPFEYDKFPLSKWPPPPPYQYQDPGSSAGPAQYSSRQEETAAAAVASAARGVGPSGLSNRDEKKHRLWSERTKNAVNDEADDDDDYDDDDGEPSSSSIAASAAATAAVPADSANASSSAATAATAGGNRSSGDDKNLSVAASRFTDDPRTTVILHNIPGDEKITQDWLRGYICKKGRNKSLEFLGSFDFFHFQHCTTSMYSHLPRNQPVKRPDGFLVSVMDKKIDLYIIYILILMSYMINDH